MGLETATAHPLVVEPKHLIQAADSSVVTPTAVDALTDAFRKGAITPLDIQNRQQQNQKNELDLQNMQREQAFNSDPQIVEARRAAAIAHGSIARAAQATAESSLKLQPLTEELDRTSKVNAIFQNDALGDKDKYETGFSLAGIKLPRRPDGTVDVEAAQPIADSYKQYAAELTRLGALTAPHSKQVYKNTTANGGETETTVSVNALGQPIQTADVNAVKSLQAGGFTGWLAKRNATAAAPAAPAVSPVVITPLSPDEAGKQRANLFNSGNQKAASMSDAEISALVQPKVAAKVDFLPAPGQTDVTLGRPVAGQPGMVTAVKEAPEKPSKPLTEAQANSVMYAARMQQANSTIQSSKLDPTAKVAAGLAAITPHAFLNEERQIYDGATEAFLLGVLRRESGAAISAQERSQYGKFFIPRAGETPAAVKDKAERRQLAVEMMRTTADPNFTVPANADAFNALVKNLALTKGAVAPAAAQGTPAKTLSTGRTIGVTPSGQFYKL